MTLWVPETEHRRLTCRYWSGARRHDRPVPTMLIYQMFVKLLSWIVLRTRSDAAKEIEILVRRHQLAVLQRPAGAAPIALPTASAQPVHRASSDPTPAATDRGRGVQIDMPEMVQAPRSPGGPPAAAARVTR